MKKSSEKMFLREGRKLEDDVLIGFSIFGGVLIGTVSFLLLFNLDFVGTSKAFLISWLLMSLMVTLFYIIECEDQHLFLADLPAQRSRRVALVVTSFPFLLFFYPASKKKMQALQEEQKRQDMATLEYALRVKQTTAARPEEERFPPEALQRLNEMSERQGKVPEPPYYTVENETLVLHRKDKQDGWIDEELTQIMRIWTERQKSGMAVGMTVEISAQQGDKRYLLGFTRVTLDAKGRCKVNPLGSCARDNSLRQYSELMKQTLILPLKLKEAWVLRKFFTEKMDKVVRVINRYAEQDTLCYVDEDVTKEPWQHFIEVSPVTKTEVLSEPSEATEDTGITGVGPEVAVEVGSSDAEVSNRPIDETETPQ